MVNFILVNDKKSKKNNEPKEVIEFSHWSLYPIDNVKLLGQNKGIIIKYAGLDVKGYKKEIEIPEYKILSFWDSMDELNIWKWKRKYEHPKFVIIDGHMWSLKLKSRTGKLLETKGSNYYPSKYKKFIECLNHLFDAKIEK